MATAKKPPNVFIEIVLGLISGAFVGGSFAQFWATGQWEKTAPLTPTGDAVYPYDDHGIVYLNAAHATAAHLYFALWAGALITIIIAALARGENPFSRKASRWSSTPLVVSQLIGAVLTIAALWVFGEALLAALPPPPLHSPG